MADARAVAKRVAAKAPVKQQAPSRHSGAFTAPHPVYSGGIYYETGQVFVTSVPAGAMWEAMSGASVTSQ
ncbi:hypothetical protein G4G27_15120 [Sphingomonas sp. So64.6b]|uniref:hypothetical protein n=1 Tax=Sphingomonas sp. So64.6b TaxID=2997354 RepID=UPI001601FB5A|nr:hypothetical protein [Sphingomonas sp. So64.6b]QNA85179.1 hypothetical protein G4G27_15120 [Sphingomonas sp. So64.6b]